MRILLIVLLTLLICVDAQADTMHYTCYTPESAGRITASGAEVREGICASNQEHFGDCALIYTLDGQFMGYYECIDIGGTEGIKKGTVIDVWMPSNKKAKEMMALTQGMCEVVWVKKPKG